jgi:hypothetical protein
MAKPRENAYICVLINFLQRLPRVKNVHPVFGPSCLNGPYAWADEHVLMSSYEHVHIHSCRMSRWACAHHEQLRACAHTLMQDEQMSMCSWAWAVMSMCSWAVMSMCSWAVMSMCSYAHRPKLYPTWFWKSNKIYTFPVNWASPRPWTTSKLAVNTKLKWTCFVTGFRKQKWSVFVTLGFIDFGFIVFHCYNQSITEPIASRSPYFAWGRTILNKGKWLITI